MDWHRINFAFLITLLIQNSNYMVRCVITDVQLVGGPSSNKGTVEIRQDGGNWETTCGINLDINDVMVICRQLGFTGASLAMQTTPFRQNSTPDIGLDCNGGEGNVAACSTLSHASGCSPAGAASCHGEGYLGCFKDNKTDRVLSSNFKLSSASINISYCIWFCRLSITSYYTYAGVGNGNECYCGVASDNYARHGVGVDSDCSVPCQGDPTESCGGIGYIAVFRSEFQY
ncbi:kremen protein 1-like [Lytechinus pictus]|uniref:kremen protein 1-like n=1 Tax=Lytechinus pictus TaxID=7653 RepID=UPI0030B9F2C7